MSDPVTRLAAAVGDVADAPVALERPGDADHGDYATNVALRLAPVRGQAPRDLASELVERVLSNGVVESAEVAGPGFVNLRVSDAWLAEAVAEIVAAGDAFGSGSAESRQRIQVELVSANPTGPITVAHGRNGAYGDAVARLLTFAGHEVEREYYYNDAGAQMERFRAVGRRVAARRDASRGRLHGRLHAGARRAPGRSRPGRARADRGDARALPCPLRHVGARERGRGGHPGGDRAPRHVRAGRRGLGADERARRRQGPRARPLGRHADLLRRRRRLHPATSSRAASTGSSTSSARTTTATSRASRRSPRCSGTRATRSRC